MTGDRQIMLAAGGTGGHIFPAISVAEEMLKRGYRVSLITDSRGVDLGRTLSEVQVYRINASGIRGNIPQKVSGVLSIGIGVLQARRLFSRHRPLCVIGFGGYPSVPTMLAATLSKLPTIIHEQNAVIGRANRLVAKRVSTIATSFNETAGVDAGSASKITHTGNPVRAAFSQVRQTPYPRIGPNGEDIRILVLGGSQGATVFSDIVPAAITNMPETLRRRFAITQQCRPEDIDRAWAKYASVCVASELSTFFDDMPQRMAAAHIIITRSGASTVAELAEAGRPAILVPYPHATDDHQSANARSVENHGAGWLIPHDGFTPEALTMHLERFVNHPDVLNAAAAAAHQTGGKKAAAKLADLAVSLGGKTVAGGAAQSKCGVREMAA